MVGDHENQCTGWLGYFMVKAKEISIIFIILFISIQFSFASKGPRKQTIIVFFGPFNRIDLYQQ